MSQTQAFTLEEALIYVENTTINTLNGSSLPFIQETVLQLLSQMSSMDSQNVQTPDNRSEVALWVMLIVSLICFDECHGVIITESDALAQKFFTKELFNDGGPYGVDLAKRCSKTLVHFTSEYDLAEAEQRLNDYNTIPIMSLSTYRTMLNKAETDPDELLEIKPIPWWKKMFASQPKPTMSPLKMALCRTNLVVKVLEKSVGLESEAMNIMMLKYDGL